MQRHVKDGALSLGARIPPVRWQRRAADFAIRFGQRSIFINWLVNVLAYASRFVRILSNRYVDGSFNYSADLDGLTSAAPLRFNDLEANFFIRLVLERSYSHVIEIGAYKLERAAGLARLFPSVTVHGLDITRDFTERRAIDGVRVGPNTLANIQSIAKASVGRGLICCRGTLVYYPPEQLRELFAFTHALEYDLAISEPNTALEQYIEVSRTRTKRTWYHPFRSMLKAAGYALPDNDGQQIRCSISEYGEERTFIFALCQK
jgi:hypothetical protein